MHTLLYNIGTLAGLVPAGVRRKQGREMAEVGRLENAWLRMEDGRIAAFGKMPPEAAEEGPDGREVGTLPRQEGDTPLETDSGNEIFQGKYDRLIDAEGGMVLPAFCDPHTHIVYAGDRDREFIDKIRGLSYEEIAARGGGILNSADLLHDTSEETLYRQSLARLREMTAKGSGAVEIKSGYGLNTADELKMLRVIRRLKEVSPALIRATFLGAHAVGRAYQGRQSEYVDLICREMLPAVAAEGLADFVDVFCDRGFFTPEETERIAETGAAYGLRAKIHANELAVSGGVQAGVRCHALSVDHLEMTGEAEIEALKGSETMPTLLPGSSFFLGLPFGKARELIDAGLGIALASDYNPGSSPAGDMRFVWALGCIRMKLLPEEAFNACTLNAAYAMGVSDLVGSITPGKLANLILTRPLPSFACIPYYYQSPFLRSVFLRGEETALG